MKLNSFKFQDGKVFWLPEYPSKDLPLYQFLELEAQSLASVIEVAPEDADVVKIQIWWCNIWTHGLDKQHANQNTFNQIIELWQPENGKVYSAECEMEVKTIWEPLGIHPLRKYQLSVARQVARLKPV